MAGSRTHWFADPNLTETTAELRGENLNRAWAMRIRPGETFTLTDGRGYLASCEMTAINRERAEFSQLGWQQISKPVGRNVIQAITKHDPVESALRLATEFGATGLTPWQANRSVSRWSPAQADKQLQRLSAIASDQSLLNHLAWFPRVNNLCQDLPAPEGSGFILTPEADIEFAELLRAPMRAAELAMTAVTFVVGPEGGHSDSEIQRASDLGYVAVSLGSVSYRSVSAAAAALALLGALTPTS